MLNVTKLKSGLFGLIGWEQHYDTAEIEIVDTTLLTSSSGHKYQSYHPSLRLDLIQASIPDNRELDEYLKTVQENAITQLANDIIVKRGFDEYATKTLANDVILDKSGFASDTIMNTGRFCGFIIKTTLSIGLRNVIKSIGFQQTARQEGLNIYVYHSSKKFPITKIEIDTAGSAQFSWTALGDNGYELMAEGDDIVGGYWIVGYYQDDLDGQAVQYKNFDWITGPCGTCDGGGQRLESFRNLMQYMQIQPFYVPEASLPDPEEEEAGSGDFERPIMDIQLAFKTFDVNFGMNFKISAECDLTDFVLDHKASIVQALGYKVAMMIMHDIQYTTEVNHIEENLKSLIIRDLEGDKATKGDRMCDKYDRAIQQVNFDHSKKSAFCLPCKHTEGVKYDVA